MRTVIADRPGPVDLTIDTWHAHLTVIADPAISVAEIVLSPVTPGDREAVAAVESARVRSVDNRIIVRARALRRPTEHTGDGGTSATPVPDAPQIRIDARVPAASTITSDIGAGAVRMVGPLDIFYCDDRPAVVDLSGVVA